MNIPESMIQQEDHMSWEIYDKVCQARFDKIETKVDSVHAVVTNGLSDKVKMSVKLSWWAIGLFFTGFASVLAFLFKLYGMFSDHLIP